MVFQVSAPRGTSTLQGLTAAVAGLDRTSAAVAAVARKRSRPAARHARRSGTAPDGTQTIRSVVVRALPPRRHKNTGVADTGESEDVAHTAKVLKWAERNDSQRRRQRQHNRGAAQAPATARGTPYTANGMRCGLRLWTCRAWYAEKCPLLISVRR